MQPQDIEVQAWKLYYYVKRGGDAERWLDSKGFDEDERVMIALAYGKIVEND